MQFCPGCLTVARTSSGVVQQQRATMSPGALSWTTSQGGRRVNGGVLEMAAADANGNGGPTPTAVSAAACSDLVCSVCGRATEKSFYCQSCGDAVDTAAARPLCQSCWQQHQLDVHVFPRLRLDSGAVSSSPELQSLMSSQLTVGGDQQQRGRAAVTTSSSGVLRQIRPRPMMSSNQSAAVSSLLGGLVMHAGASAVTESSSSLVVANTSSSGASSVGGGLLAVGLHDAAVRRRRLAVLQAPLAGQYEGWLWQALNNGGFEQAARSIDERKQQIGVNLQSTLRDMEFRLERARGVLDDLYREYMRQVIDVTNALCVDV